MKTKIVLVAAWDGWCGSCAVERPLVLTRSGRLGLRTWLTAPVVESRPLTLTCRLCGFSDVVPPEADDPPVQITESAVQVEPGVRVEPVATAGAAVLDGATAPVLPATVPGQEQPGVTVPGVTVPGVTVPGVTVPVAAAPVVPAPVPVAPRIAVAPAAALAAARRDPELDRARGALGAALGALLAERTAQAARVRPVPPVAPPLPVTVAPALPLQRTAPSDSDGLATLQLLADGLDLLSSSRP